MKKKVLIIDDSAFIRKILFDMIGNFPEFEVVGMAENPKIGAEKILELKPDILTLDIEMPIMDGLTFLEKLMRLKPMPVIMISSYTEKNSKAALMSLELGAVDFIKKPAGDLEEIKTELHQKLLMACGANVSPSIIKKDVAEKKFSFTEKVIKNVPIMDMHINKLIAIGSSTGGTIALTKIFSSLPNNLPGIVIVQHMPAAFTRTFAERLNSESSIIVKEGEHGDLVKPGHAYLAPGGKQAEVLYSPEGYILQVREAPPIDRHCPSVNVLFTSVAKHAKKNAVGVILTGMGDDGARGLLEMKKSGAFTIAQDEKSCTVFGMPKVAIEMGAATKVLSLEDIIKELRS